MAYDPTQPVPPPSEPYQPPTGPWSPPLEPTQYDDLTPPPPPPPPLAVEQLPYWQVKPKLQASSVVAVSIGLLMVLCFILYYLGVFNTH